MNEALAEVAKKIVWFKTPVAALENRLDFLCRVMALATIDDYLTVRKFFSDDDFRAALKACPPGVMDQKSWNYWHLKLAEWPPPPMPKRKL